MFKEMKDFVNSFYKVSQMEMLRKNEENEKMKEIAEIESNQAKQFLNTKIKEITKDADEKILLFTKNLMNPVEEALAEKEKAKKK